MLFKVGPEFPEDEHTRCDYQALVDAFDLHFPDPLLPQAATNGLVYARREGGIYAPGHAYDRCNLSLIYRSDPENNLAAYDAKVRRFPFVSTFAHFAYTALGGCNVDVGDGRRSLVLPSQYGIMHSVILATTFGPIQAPGKLPRTYILDTTTSVSYT